MIHRGDFRATTFYSTPCLSNLCGSLGTAARLITKQRQFDSITPILFDLHWLPAQKRVEFKILLLASKVINGLAPVLYIQELLSLYTPSRSLRSENSVTLSKKVALSHVSTKTLFYGNRSFASAAPVLWNNLPFNLRSCRSIDIFKTGLKTHLFSQHFIN